MIKKIIIIFLFSILLKDSYSSKLKSLIKIKKDMDEKDSLVDIHFFKIKKNLVKDCLNIKVSLIKQEPYNKGLFLKLGLPIKIGSKTIFLGLKGLNDSYFLTIDNLGFSGNIRLYIKTLFESKNIRYGFESSISCYKDNEIKFTFIKPYLNYLYKNKNFKSVVNFRIGIEEYYKTEKPFSDVKELFYNNLKDTDEVKTFLEKLQNIEMLLKIKNKRYKKNFLKIFSKQKYKLLKELSIGFEETFDYSMVSINNLSNILIKVSPFIKLEYNLFKNLMLNHKFQIKLNHGFGILNNYISILFETKLNYSF